MLWNRVELTLEVGQAVAAFVRKIERGGKSGLRRAGCRLMAGRREAMESGSESGTADGRGDRP